MSDSPSTVQTNVVIGTLPKPEDAPNSAPPAPEYIYSIPVEVLDTYKVELTPELKQRWHTLLGEATGDQTLIGAFLHTCPVTGCAMLA